MPMDLDAIERRFDEERQQMAAEDRAREDARYEARARELGVRVVGWAVLETNAPTLSTEWFLDPADPRRI